ncbi:helicase-related protein [Methanomethylophilus alvi]|uniref:helicase-related protein n=1 Tax=Methanomethylophilus alvi TaxID=1291540 RepID=UPI0037DC03B5
MEFFDNQTNIVRDDLKKRIRKGSKVSIAAACFSIYAYKELREELEKVDEVRFIFTSPTFSTDETLKTKKDRKQFYIPKVDRERSLYGTEFEIKLRNEMTLKAISRECADWVKRKAKFKTNTTNSVMQGMMNIETGKDRCSYNINDFSTSGIGCDKGNMIYNNTLRLDAEESLGFFKTFESIWNDAERLEDVTKNIADSFSQIYNENPPEFIYFMTLYNIFNEFLDDINEDVLPDDNVGFKNTVIWNKLYDFQKDAALAIINKLEKYNGCILADSVGLGKTFTALAVIKYYEMRNKSVLVLCPKKLSENWNTYRNQYKTNPLIDDRLNYTVLYHTDLSRKHGKSNGQDLSQVYWENFNLVVIDESHNFKNGSEYVRENRRNRYQVLLEDVVKKGVKTKVLMLSATPVNNRFMDLKNQLALAYEGDSRLLDEKLNTTTSLEKIFKDAQAAYNKWSKLPPEERKTEVLLDSLSFDFFEVLDSVTIARSRKHIERYYKNSNVGKFPDRRPPVSIRPKLTDSNVSYNEIYTSLLRLNLDIYTPSKFIHESKRDIYDDSAGNNRNVNSSGREEGIRTLMRISLLKRLESSVNSFSLTLQRVLTRIDYTLEMIDRFKNRDAYEGKAFTIDANELDYNDLDLDEQNADFTVGKKLKINLADMDWLTWGNNIASDKAVLEDLKSKISTIGPENDTKLKELFAQIDNKIIHPFNDGNKKLLIFTAFSDTAQYLFDNVSKYISSKYHLNTGMITGSVDGKTTIPGIGSDMNLVLSCFSPISKERGKIYDTDETIDILIATDCISEGQNLQDCDCVINYDIHWNPVRIIQRFGRVDRIGSLNKEIQLINFWPDIDLDEYINLKARVESRMKISIATSTGDDDPINIEEKGDLEYRKKQLEQLQKDNADIEDVSGGISIMDLGLSEFRTDLLDYIKKNPGIERQPHGMNAVISGDESHPKGVFFVLRNVNDGVNIDSRNRLHPYYMVYVNNDGETIINHLNPKKLLDSMRFLCRDKSEVDELACKEFNMETDDGRDMTAYSELLRTAVSSIIDVNADSDIDSLFSGGETTALINDVSGLEDFELICFLVVR